MSIEEDDFLLDDDDDGERKIIGFYCIACGHTQKQNSWGGECETCTSCCLEEIYDDDF